MGHTSRQLVVKLLIRPVTPAGPVLTATGGQVQKGHEASHPKGHTRCHQHQPSTHTGPLPTSSQSPQRSESDALW